MLRYIGYITPITVTINEPIGISNATSSTQRKRPAAAGIPAGSPVASLNYLKGGIFSS